MSQRQGRDREGTCTGAGRSRGRRQGRQPDDDARQLQQQIPDAARGSVQATQGQYRPQQQPQQRLGAAQLPSPPPPGRPATAQPTAQYPPPPSRQQRPTSSPGTAVHRPGSAPAVPQAGPSAAVAAGAWAAGPPTSRTPPPIPRPPSSGAGTSSAQQPGRGIPTVSGGAWGRGPGTSASASSSGSIVSGRSPARGLGPGRMGRGRGGRPPQHQQRGYQDAQVAPIAEGQRSMVHAMQTGSARTFKQDVPQSPDVMPATRPPVGVLGSSASLLVNLYLLELTGRHMLHYDVAFERVRTGGTTGTAGVPREPNRAGSSRGSRRSGRGGRPPTGSAAAQVPDPPPPQTASDSPSAAAGTGISTVRNPKPPDNAREIMLEFERQHWSAAGQAPVVYAYDGAKNLVTPSAPPLLSGVPDVSSPFVVQDIKTPGQDQATSWQLTFKLTRSPINLATMRQMAQQMADTITAGDRTGLTDLLNLYQDQRQLHEWVLRSVLLSRTGGQEGVAAALKVVNEVGRTLYFTRNPAPKNIGGGLCALCGLQTGVKLTQTGLMFAADITTSAFLKTDINLVEWMCEVAGLGGPSGGGGRGPSSAQRLVELYWRDKRLQLRIARALKNRKVVYRTPGGSVCKYQAAGLSAEPADRSYFELKPRDGSDAGAQRLTVAQYFQQMGQPLLQPQLPVVVMKLPKNSKMEQVWLPPERLSFDKNQRVKIITHKGGTEAMIDTARKQPDQLKQAIHGALNPSGSEAASGPSKRLERGFGVRLASNMTRIDGRVLPGPWLRYQTPGGGASAINTGQKGSWNMNALQFTEPASIESWGLLAVLQKQEFDIEGPTGLRFWVGDLVKRMAELGINVGNMRPVWDAVMQNVIWVSESATMLQLQAHLRDAKDRAEQTFGKPCKLVVCFIREKPSPVYRDIKVAAELIATDDLQRKGGQTLGFVTQVVVARKTDLGQFAQYHANKRSQYQANLCMKINAKIGGINTKWAAEVGQLLRSHFKLLQQAPSLMVFGIDLTPRPSRRWQEHSSSSGKLGQRSVQVQYIRYGCLYGHQVWQEPTDQAGNEAVSEHNLITAAQQLLKQHYTHNNSSKPGCLIIYRDGVSDAELESVRQLEVGAILKACSDLEESYRPRVVYVVVQKRHSLRFFTVDGSNKGNVAPGTVVDHTIVSPWLFDFYLNSHAAIIGTSRAARYICLLDELGFGSDGLETFTYWLCYLYCRCARSVSIVAPVYYAHLLAFRARMLSDDIDGDSVSMRSGSSGSSRVPRFGQYAKELECKMFFV